MPSAPTYEICTCSKCGTQVWQDPQGRTHRGAIQSSVIKQRHIRADAAQAAQAGMLEPAVSGQSAGRDEGTHFGDSILLSTVASIPPPPGEFAPNRLDVSKKHSREPGSLLPEASTSRTKRLRTGAAPADQEPGLARSAATDQNLSEASDALAGVKETLQMKMGRFSELGPLRFQDPPKTLQEVPGPLDMSDPMSQQVEVYSSWLENAAAIVHSFDSITEPALSARRQALKHDLTQETDRLKAAMRSQWDQQKAKAGLYGGADPAVHASAPFEFDTSRFFQNLKRQSWILAALVVVVGLHALSNLSRNEASLILNLVHIIFNGVLTSPEAQSIFAPTPPSSTRLAENERSLNRNIPLDVRTATKRLDLEPEYMTYVCCPKCFATYGATDSTGKLYPTHCSHRDTPSDEPCGAALLKPGGEKLKELVPIKPYPFHSLREWLCRLLSRTGIEDILDKAWELPAANKDIWADIMHAPGIREFKGPDGATLFSSQPHGTYHLVFSLFVDWFNPFGNKSAGKHHSVGAIYMVCLNLPPELRYRTENMFLVGIIPGPKEPQKDELTPDHVGLSET